MPQPLEELNIAEARGYLRQSGRRTFWKHPDSGAGLQDYEPAEFQEANLVSSLMYDGRHQPVLDLDVPHLLVPSSTPGHGHLYLEVPMSWFKYRLLLWVLRYTGIIGRGYYYMATQRRQTLVRKPGITKEATASWGNTRDDRGVTFDS